jgi:hypothetical protein
MLINLICKGGKMLLMYAYVSSSAGFRRRVNKHSYGLFSHQHFMFNFI